MIKCGDAVIQPTIFPDKTSQVWQDRVDLESPDVWWWFENEAEFIHLAQFLYIRAMSDTPIRSVVVPFLPYARQHGDMGGAFALGVFINLFDSPPCRFSNVAVLDSHFTDLPPWIINVSPDPLIRHAIEESGADLILYPDEGARKRYGEYGLPTINCEKDRDPTTGKIRGLYTSIESAALIKGKRVLIVDDILDGGATFIRAADLARAFGAHQVFAYATHGIFSKGIKPLRDAGIDQLYTTNSLRLGQDMLRNVTVFDVEPAMKGIAV